MLILLCILVFILILFLYLICPNLTRRKAFNPYRHMQVAHRGYWNLEKSIAENSLEAFQRAIDHGYAIEIDVHLTGDGQLVVFHDYTLSRVCGVDYTIEKTDYATLSRQSLSGTASHIPTFQEVLDLVDGRVPLLIELKLPSGDPLLCKETYALLKHYKGAYLIQSFNTIVLHWFKENAPEVLRGQLSGSLTLDEDDSPYILRFFAENLLVNVYGRPDFISYQYSARKNFSLQFCRKVFHTPIALWTLRTPKAIKETLLHYDCAIFEETV